MTRSALALRIVAFGIAVLWWLPTIVMMFSGLAWREARFRRRLARVRRLRRAGRLGEAEAALDRLQRDRSEKSSRPHPASVATASHHRREEGFPAVILLWKPGKTAAASDRLEKTRCGHPEPRHVLSALVGR